MMIIHYPMANNRYQIFKKHFLKVNLYLKCSIERNQMISDCEPVDLTEYESRQQQIVQTAVEKWLKT